jgi:hypothetical protein
MEYQHLSKTIHNEILWIWQTKKKSFYSLYDFKHKQKSLYMTNTDRSKMLESEENYQTDQQYEDQLLTLQTRQLLYCLLS